MPTVRRHMLPRRVDARTDEEWIAANEAAVADANDQTVITVSSTLLPEIQKLLVSHKGA